MIVPYEHLDRLHKLPPRRRHRDDGAGCNVWKQRFELYVPTA